MSLERKVTDLFLKIFPLRIMRPHLFKINRFVEGIAWEYDKVGKKLLDIGAEGSPYRKLFVKLKYVSHDIEQNEQESIDIVGDLNEGLPEIRNSTFDYVLCTQVLEHVRRPHVAFEEFNRILKSGGRLFLTTHMVFDEHMVPNDFFRFTKYGLKSLGEDAGFKVVSIKPHGGVFLVVANILNELPIKILFNRGTWRYYLYLVLFSIPIFFFNLIMYLLDFLDTEKTLTTNYECIYEKI